MLDPGSVRMTGSDVAAVPLLASTGAISSRATGGEASNGSLGIQKVGAVVRVRMV